MTKEYFLNKANYVHGNKYQYIIDNDNIDNKETIKIVCPLHGHFNLIVNNHLNGRGCPKCKKEEKNKIRQEQFKIIFCEKAKEIHGNKYDYSKVDYIKAKSKVCIICPEHGEFWQTPDSHLKGSGCPVCGNINSSIKQTLSLADFIQKAKEIHDDKYDYSKVEYVNHQIKVYIICPEHGEFWQTPNNHLSGKGCPKCIGRNKTTQDFIDEVIQKFGNIYDFNKTKYINSQTKVTIGYNNKFFEIEPRKLLVSSKPITKERVYNQNDFIEKAKEIHGNKYDYSKVDYINSQTKVCIICPEHGEFWQRPNVHLNKHGCPFCKTSKLEEIVKLELNKNNIRYIHQYYPKILSKKFSHQSLDFYLPDYNIAIECQGRQHFIPIKYFGGEEKLKQQIILDSTKFKKCNDNGIKILYLIDSHINIKNIEDNIKYNNIYMKDNCFKQIKRLLSAIKS